MKRLLAITLFLIVTSVYWYKNNDYMTFHDYHVTMVEKMKDHYCHKSKCRLTLKGLFKTEDGTFFDLDLTMASYTRLNPGDKAVFELRPFDIKQTGMQNLFSFFMPCIYHSLTFVMVVLCVIAGIHRYRTREE